MKQKKHTACVNCGKMTVRIKYCAKCHYEIKHEKTLTYYLQNKMQHQLNDRINFKISEYERLKSFLFTWDCPNDLMA